MVQTVNDDNPVHADPTLSGVFITPTLINGIGATRILVTAATLKGTQVEVSRTSYDLQAMGDFVDYNNQVSKLQALEGKSKALDKQSSCGPQRKEWQNNKEMTSTKK
ncbi:unnamed protein product [Dovyalis caffra]|uniref:Uncharacterized protein n=1 Tax=Dovyalis caffra TaxID=77055 RepID=A0AAV1SLI7_9ROSI|nr:unnamed protein product [Dovyalis caffra]